MMDRSPICYVTSFVGIGTFVQAKEMFEGVYLMILYGRCGHFGHVTQMPGINFCSPCQRRYHIKFGFNWPCCFGEDL